MYKQKLPSALLEDAVAQIGMLPGIGNRSALRMALYLLRQPVENVRHLSDAIIRLRENVRYCSVCGMISENDICSICSDSRRNASLVCVVESLRDVLSIEATGQYNGVYHVLGGVISPIDGIGPSDLSISSLVERVGKGGVSEVVLALSTGVEGETTSYYIYRQLQSTGVKVTAIARGVGFGDELEYTDEVTLGRSIADRREFRP
ncbi:MAG: recombination protein RecR [Bacteroidetes bacterium]|uniref:Recombination protein RecR n=1 Tax=Candidatus Merdivivens pullicola TaxID=2840872 RepID=A0A9D9NG86_9BACT|nr:recombination protein RecR [Candidatus Merdivivens pullicola]